MTTVTVWLEGAVKEKSVQKMRPDAHQRMAYTASCATLAESYFTVLQVYLKKQKEDVTGLTTNFYTANARNAEL